MEIQGQQRYLWRGETPPKRTEPRSKMPLEQRLWLETISFHLGLHCQQILSLKLLRAGKKKWGSNVAGSQRGFSGEYGNLIGIKGGSIRLDVRAQNSQMSDVITNLLCEEHTLSQMMATNRQVGEDALHF